MDIQKLANDAVEKLIKENKIAEMVESGVQNAIKTAIDEQFRSYGGVSRQIKKALKEGLQLDISELPFETYNQQMLVAVKQKLGNAFMTDASNVFMAELEDMLKPAPKEISINELVEAIISYWKTDEPWGADDIDEEATVQLTEPEWSTDGTSFSLEMWKQKDGGRYGSSRFADVSIYISNGNIRINHRASYNPTCFSKEDALIFKLYAAKTLVTGLTDFDPSDCDLTLKQLDY